MEPKSWISEVFKLIDFNTPFMNRHMEYMEKFVAIDSRSFGVNEYPGDRTSPSDMKEILELASTYLKEIGFQTIKINSPSPHLENATPILMAEMHSGKDKPTVLLYAHLDKQPYMDDDTFQKWGGIPPTQLTWNKNKTRAYGRGAADDLSGVIATGMAVDALLKSLESKENDDLQNRIQQLPCNIKIIFETEEESGSNSLMEQIHQNLDFFSSIDCVIITDVTNPETGKPGLTTSLRGLVQTQVQMQSVSSYNRIDEQTALYKALATLIDGNQVIAIEGILDTPVTSEEKEWLALIPISIETLRSQAGLLNQVLPTVANEKVSIIESQFRKSFVNVRPGQRVTGSVILGAAGVRFIFNLSPTINRNKFHQLLFNQIEKLNRFHLKIDLNSVETNEPNHYTLDLILQSSIKDPHSGVNGGPFPIPEIQLAKIIDKLISTEGILLVPDIDNLVTENETLSLFSTQQLSTHSISKPVPFEKSTASCIVEIRLAPGSDDEEVLIKLINHLKEKTPQGFKLSIEPDKSAKPWLTSISQPAFKLMWESLEKGFNEKPCLYGCGGTIPFIKKLTDALGPIPPLCIGVYDTHCQMHEPGESLSMVDLIGGSRSITHFLIYSQSAFP